LLSAIGAACDIVAPALTPRAPGARVKTDRRDAKRLLVLHRAGALTFVAPPTVEQEGLRDLVRCRDDLVCARRAARHRVGKQLLRHGHIFREGKKSWTKQHIAWVRRQRLADPLAHSALEHMLAHLDSVDAQIAAIDHQLEQIAAREPWNDPVRWLCCFRGITTLTALGLLAELGDLRRFGTARELMSFLGLTPSEYSSGEQRHRGHITKTGPRHARRLLIEAAWHYQHPPRVSQRIAAVHPHVPPDVAARAFSAQIRLHHRHRTLTDHGKRSTVTNVAVARELAGFIWAAMTRQPLRDQEVTAA
jgi:transposase